MPDRRARGISDEVAPRILGRKTALRPIASKDTAFIKRWLNDPEVMRYWGGVTETLDDRQAAEWVERFLDPPKGQFALIISAGDTPVGFIEVAWESASVNYGHKAEVDICIGEPSRWGQGLGTDALTALLRWFFTSTDVVRVFLQPRVVNMRAVHVYEKVGFRKEGVLRHGERVDGELSDTVMMAALRGEWLSEFGAP